MVGLTADGDFEHLREPITESVRTWEKMADAVDEAEEERLFLQYPQPLIDTLDSMASDPPSHATVFRRSSPGIGGHSVPADQTM